MKIRQNTFLVSILWLLLLAASFAWNSTQAEKEQEFLALHTARSLSNHILFTCLWNAGYGGVYVPISETTPADSIPHSPLDIIKINDTLTLVRINPALMTKQIAAIAKGQNIHFDIVSIQSMHSINKATEQEEALLRKFETGLQEAGPVH